MARNLLLKQNVNPQNSEYPYGQVRDNDGSNNGTPVNEEVYGDFHQFFAKMFAESGLTYNNVPDNAYDGFQYYDAMVAIITLGINVNATNELNKTWDAMSLVNNWINTGSGSYNDAEYQIDEWGWVHLRGKIKRSNASTGNGVGIAILPSGYRPTKDESFVTLAYSPIGYGGYEAIHIHISSSGSIVPHAMVAGNVLLLLNQASDFVSLDGISFKIT